MAAENVLDEQMKRLVLCVDGTWNTPESDQITNIVRLRDLIDPKFRSEKDEVVKQRVYYEPGVGTDGTKLKRRFEGATGGGLEDNVRGAYRFLSSVYRPDLEIYIFGFSRGAFTARSLAGYIGASGLLKPQHCNEENERSAWAYYRTSPKFRFPSARFALDQISFENVRIKVLGVFDTVGSRGIPVRGILDWYNAKHFGFHDVALSPIVDHAFHALAIDEKRLSFPASVWGYPNHKDNLTVEQVWFPGNHANVGGGYSDNSLSDIALDWMLSRIEDKGLGLRFVSNCKSRLTPNALGTLNDETRDQLLYATGRFYPTIRTINQCLANVWGSKAGLPPHGIPIGEMLHWTALQRLEESSARYAPPNLLSALAAAEAGTHLIPIVGKSSRPLFWFNNKEDRDELLPQLSPRLRDRLARVFANLKDADTPLNVREEAKLQAGKEV
jgi:hypothetical protein